MAWKRVRLLLAVAFFVASMPLYVRPATAAPDSSTEVFRYFPETGHNISLQIKNFYDRHGGLRIFGLPLTEVIEEDGRLVQYFERARYEIHPENPAPHYIQLTLLGSMATQGRSDSAFARAQPANPQHSTYFPQTGHNLSQGFRAFWRKYGGLPVFGYPLSEEFVEVSPTDGKSYTVQYFERARFEWHPEYGVQLGLLGSEYALQRNLPQALRAPVKPVVKLGEATTVYRGSSEARVHNIARAASAFNGVRVGSGEVLSFLDTVGEISEDTGYVEGHAIVGGELATAIGGGICQVSTTFYRAVFRAGLEIVERYPHSYIVYFYENIAGFDATVFSPYVDFRWRNDTPYEIYISTATDVSSGTVTFTLWGIGDGRSAEMVGPEVSNVTQPGQPIWQYDSSLGYGDVHQVIHGRSGMDVDMWRKVYRADGSLLKKEHFFTRYKPWEDWYLYGPGVTPPQGVRVVDPVRHH